MNFELTYTGAKMIAAALFALPGLFALIAPKFYGDVCKAFPRSFTAGKVLSAAAFIWAALIVYLVPLDFIMKVKVPIAAALIISIPLSWNWIPELLAARSLGALWCLIPAPVLVASRFEDDNMRLLIVSLMYVVAVAGMFVTFSPYLLRDFITWLTGSEKGIIRIRIYGLITTFLGIACFL